MKLNKLNRNPETVRAENCRKTSESFHRNQNEFNKKQQVFAEIITVHQNNHLFHHSKLPGELRNVKKKSHSIRESSVLPAATDTSEECFVNHMPKTSEKCHSQMALWEEEYRIFQ
jgi:hypothetical protein